MPTETRRRRPRQPPRDRRHRGGPPLFRPFRITDSRARGLALGISSRAIGTSRAFDMDAETGAVLVSPCRRHGGIRVGRKAPCRRHGSIAARGSGQPRVAASMTNR
ncbi:LrgB family protein [Micromonospora olivasterospora]|uniref:LrgB family protein n=1 Tax=Micromonospora olivasterospora TaxID=1880 RepID=UPI001B87E84E